MNVSLKALIISLALHCVFLFLVYALSAGLDQPSKPIRIDFTLNEPASGPPTPKPAGPTSPKPAVPASPKVMQNAQQTPPRKQTVNSPRIAAQKPVDRPSAPLAPATEKAGPAPIMTARRDTLPVPGASYSKEGGSTGGGQGTAGHGSIGGGGSSGSGGGGSGGGNGEGGTEQLRSRYRKEHFEYIRKIIQEHIVYPPRAQRNGWGGRVVVMFSVLQSGKVKDIRIRKSSGYEILDDNVIETIRKVEPFPKPPVAVELVIPVAYNL